MALARMANWVIGPWIAAWVLSICGAASAESRLVRRLEDRQGNRVNNGRAITQDDRGFIWIGSVDGVFRYDGEDLVSWARSTLHTEVAQLVPEQDGIVLARTASGDLYRIGAGLVRLTDERGEPWTDVRSVARTDDGAIWVSSQRGLWRREAGGAWRQVRVALGSEARPLRALAPAGDAIFGAGPRSIWRVEPSGNAAAVYTAPRVVDIAVGPDMERIGAVSFDGDAFLCEPRAGCRSFHVPQRGTSVGWRGEDLWIAHTDTLSVWRPDDQVISSSLPGGGLLIDAEGLLWLATFDDVLMLPEPDTVFVTVDDGLPTNATRYLAHGAHGVWVSTWGGAALVNVTKRGISAEPIGGRAIGGICTDAHDTLWRLDVGYVAEHREGFSLTHPLDVEYAYRCTTALDGTVWLAAHEGLVHTSLDGPPDFAPPVIVDGRETGIKAVAFELDRTMWVATESARVCAAPGEAYIRGESVRWRCEPPEVLGEVFAFHLDSDGTLWAASRDNGVLRLRAGAWETIPGSLEEASRVVYDIRPSLRGGVWVASSGSVIRVQPDERRPEGWRVLERLGERHGMSGPGAGDVLELANGDLWLTTTEGVVFVPRAARDRELPTPVVRELARAGDRAKSESPLVPGDNEVEIRFAVASFVNRSRLRHRIRLRPDDVWHEGAGVPRLHVFNLAPGEYAPQVAVSLDGGDWSQPLAAGPFAVDRYWYGKPTTWVLALVLLGAVGYSLHRLRLAIALREERERSRIAMDLHDEVGAGLGQLNILAGLAAQGELSERERTSLAHRISGTAQELGRSLSDIVWSLRDDQGQVRDLIEQLRKRAEDLLNGTETTLRVTIDVPPAVLERELAPMIRREVYRLGLEALTNAAKHSRADHIQLHMGIEDDQWILRIQDDGIGIAAKRSGGMGLLNMSRRAARVGARLIVDNAEPGTLVELSFGRDTAPGGGLGR